MSSIDTKSLVAQMMAVERRPQDLLKRRVTQLQKTQNTWQGIADKLTALKTAADELAPQRAAEAVTTARTSNADIVAVSPKGAGRAVSAAITVQSLAAARSDVSTDVFTGATDLLAGRTLTLTVGGTPTTYTSADGTIGGLVNAINAADKGVDAKLLQTAPGQFQLALTASATGTAASFSASGTGWTGFTTARPASDAVFTVDGISVTRPSNTVADVIDGLELQLKSTSASPVEVSFARDDQAISDKVKAMVDAANAAMSAINTATRTSSEESARGPLAGDPSARRLADSIRSVVAAPVTLADGTTMTAKSLGVTLNRDGTLKFDAAELKKSLTERPDAVMQALGRSTSSTAAGVSITSTTASASAGARLVSVTQAASQASMVSVPTPPPPPGSTVNMTIVTPQGTFSVSFSAGNSYSQTASNMSAAMRSLGLRMSASATSSGGVETGLRLTEDRFGSAHTFSVSGAADLGLDGAATPGTDAAGTLDGQPFTAVGRGLNSGGLSISVATTAEQLAAAGGTVSGTVNFRDGLAGALARVGASGSTTGPAVSAKTALGDQIRGLQDRISRFDTILSQRESALIRRFSTMDSLIAKLNTMNGGFGGAA